MAATRLFLFSCLLALASLAPAWAFAPFVIKDFKVEGLQRITVGTVLNYLPVEVGEELDEKRSADTIRALFKTGFFNDVRLARQGDTLVIIVQERPAISKIEISGNKDIETDQLMDALKNIGLAEGRVFDRSSLDKVEKELERQYFSQGKYGVKIKSSVTPTDDNRVDLSIEISEGSIAKIRRINIVGNQVYSDAELLGEFQLGSPTILSFLTNNDQYSRQRLSGDLEALRSFYLDRGYIKFSIDSTQVTISPDKKDVYVTINISEGEKYTVRDVKLAGDLIVSEPVLRALIRISPGDYFSRRAITESTTALTERIGREGYAFANVNTSPDIDEEKREVVLTFFIDPGQRIYVNRINISGNFRTRDSVIRRELRQMEAGWISMEKLNRSKVRLQRLGYFDEVNVETPTVAGVADQVDVDISVTERSSGTISAGVGYSQTQGLLINASISQNNVFGTGNRVSATVNNGSVNKIYSFSYTNPYYTIDGVSRGFRIFSRSTDARNANVARYTSDVYGASINYGVPLSEFNRITASIGYENTQLDTSTFTPRSFLDFIARNGDEFDSYKLDLTWSYDTRNRAIFPDRGTYRSLSSSISLPLGNLEFYKLRLRETHYFSIVEDYILQLRGDIGLGDGYGETSELPFWERYYAGGVSSVRGFRSNTLGPSEDGQPVGGAFRTVGSAEFIFPVPFAHDNKSLRLSAFFDIGSVFKRMDSFNADELRYSVGLSVKWLTPMAPLTFSYGIPLNDQAGDRLEKFQFTLGTPGF